MKTPNSVYIDHPSNPLLLAGVSYWGVTTAAGATTGDSVVCAGLLIEPSYDGLMVKLLTGLAAGQVRLIATHPAPSDTLITDKPFTDATGAVVTVTASTLFVILSNAPGGGGTPPSAQAEGLYYSGTVGAVAGNQFTIAALAGLGVGEFDGATNPYSAFVVRDAGGGGLAPQGEIQVITAYVNPTGTFTTAAFGGGGIAVGDEILILHPTLAAILTSSTAIGLIFDLVNAIFTLKETGGTLVADGTQQVMVEVTAPLGVFKPTKIKIDCSNMAWGDSIILRWYERIASGPGAWIQKDELQLDNVQIPPLRNIELEPNRHGTRITLQQLAVPYKNYTWEYLWED